MIYQRLYIGKSVKKYIRASGSPCHYSYNKYGEVYKFDTEGNIQNPLSNLTELFC